MEDRAVLVETKWKTQAWKQILGRVAELGGVVDGILRVELPGTRGRPGFGTAPTTRDRR